MENTDLQAVVGEVLSRLFIELEASGRHVHVTKEQARILFGHALTPKRPLKRGPPVAGELVPGARSRQVRARVSFPKESGFSLSACVPVCVKEGCAV